MPPALDSETAERARSLLGPDGPGAFEQGASAVLLRALDAPVVSAIVAERAPAYMTLLWGLFLMRRGHELEPLHEDLERLVTPASLALDADYDGEAFVRDLDQLEAWGCIERHAEPLKIRGYKDVRRERFRYRLTDDAVAMLEWLEARLVSRVEGRSRDSRDLLTDMLGHAKEALRALRAWHAGERSPEAPRRVIYLIEAMDAALRGITEELLAFRASMLAFASRPYDIAALRGILAWLDRYVDVYLSGIEQLRGEITSRLGELSLPRFERALGECRDALARERAEAPSVMRAALALRDPGELLNAERAFFDAGGRLQALCGSIDGSARAVLRKMSRHLAELERRSARRADIRACIVAASHERDGENLLTLVNRLVASGHGRFAARAADGSRLAPPLPRSHARAVRVSAASRPLARKHLTPEAARALRASRLDALCRWIEEEVLAGRSSVLLSEVDLRGSGAPRRWLDVARASHLGQGRDLRRLGVRLADARGTAAVSDEHGELIAPNTLVNRGVAT